MLFRERELPPEFHERLALAQQWADEWRAHIAQQKPGSLESAEQRASRIIEHRIHATDQPGVIAACEKLLACGFAPAAVLVDSAWPAVAKEILYDARMPVATQINRHHGLSGIEVIRDNLKNAAAWADIVDFVFPHQMLLLDNSYPRAAPHRILGLLQEIVERADESGKRCIVTIEAAAFDRRPEEFKIAVDLALQAQPAFIRTATGMRGHHDPAFQKNAVAYVMHVIARNIREKNPGIIAVNRIANPHDAIDFLTLKDAMLGPGWNKLVLSSAHLLEHVARPITAKQRALAALHAA